MRTIDPKPFETYVGSPTRDYLGVKPGLAWLPIADLRIDPTYQREVLRNGARNVGKIAREFDWALFGVVVVANIGHQCFAIVDGQHRTIGAALRGIAEVPCVIIEADPVKQAGAFAAINAAVTKISPMQIFHAEVAAGDEAAKELHAACAAGGVSVCRYPVPSSHMKLGETIAIGTLKRALATYGAKHLSLSLRCITSNSSNVGMVREPTIKAVCHVLDAERSWCKSEPLLINVMRRFDFHAEMQAAEVAAKQQHKQVSSVLSLRLFDFLDEEIGA